MSDPSPNAAAPSITALPDKRIVVGVIVSAISAVITALAKRYLGDALLPEIATAIPVVVGFLVAYLIPMTQGEVANRVSNPIVKLANQDPDNPTTAKVVSEAESDHETAKDVALGVVPDALMTKLEQ